MRELPLAAALPEHRFFIASQFHPEFQSRPNRAHPLFAGLIKAAIDQHADCLRLPAVTSEWLNKE